MSVADREQLEILWARCDAVLLRSADIEAVHETNQDFHAAIYKGSGNEFLADAAHAHRALESRKTTGATVLVP